MSKSLHALAQQLTGKPTLEECSLDEAKRLAQRYPYFAPAQFLLLHKLRQSGTPEEADAQYKKAVLFYPDPLQFDIFVASGNFYTEEDVNKSLSDSETDFEQGAESTLAHLDESTTSEEPTTNENAFAVTVNEPSFAVLQAEAESRPAIVEAETPQGDAVNSENEFRLSSEEPERTQLNKDVEASQQTDTVRLEDTSQLATVEETSAVNLSAQTQSAPAALQQTGLNELTFEPYYTVDYFASQGIKISADELPKDKLGKGLKSFTEWLKTMKRLPLAETPSSVETAVEKKVESLADRSLDGSEVVTEAMADVWMKQGNIEKASDIYNKLSLQNPSKSAYFAAKIQTLKPS